MPAQRISECYKTMVFKPNGLYKKHNITEKTTCYKVCMVWITAGGVEIMLPLYCTRGNFIVLKLVELLCAYIFFKGPFKKMHYILTYKDTL